MSAAYEGKGSKARAKVSSERPIGTTSCSPPNTVARSSLLK